ncbi:MAG: membrane dipeptidase [Geminicoccaceae bacterium]
MDDVASGDEAGHGPVLIWDAHSCLPLDPAVDIGMLERHRLAGTGFVSVNVGMDMNPVEQILPLIASWRRQIAAMPDRYVLARGTDDVENARRTGRLAVGLDLEGAMPLLDRPDMVRMFHDLGVRQIHLAYNRNNNVCGGCYDEDVPLSALGRQVVRAVNEAGMLMDCSHTGHRSSLDIIECSSSPAFFSHANPRAIRDDRRNVTDEQIDACAARGGVVCVNGIGRFLTDVAAGTPAILDCIDYLADRIGPLHVGLGLDYSYPGAGFDDFPFGVDRGYWWPSAFGYGAGGLQGVRCARPEQIPEILEGLDRRGYGDSDRRRIMGLNMLELARSVWGAGHREDAMGTTTARSHTST